MPTNFEMVKEFRRRMRLADNQRPTLTNPDAFMLRFDLMMEELHETLRAYRTEDMVKFADGLADLLYMVYGTAAEAGIPIDEVFRVVHLANMEKRRATSTSNARGSKSDVVKPEGWRPPNVSGVLIAHGWPHAS